MGWWKVIATLRFLYCGSGDTILLELGAGNWGLLDCNLTDESGSWQALREQLDQNGVHRLTFVCLSHPDRDHYHGMRELLEERFFDQATNSPRFDQFWDSGVPIAILAAIEKRLGRKVLARELASFYRDFINPQIACGAVRLHELNDDHRPIEVGDFRFTPIGPRNLRVTRFEADAAERILGTQVVPRGVVTSLKEESNNLSTVLVLEHKRYPLRFLLGGSGRFLFGGDATADAWSDALDRWDELCGSAGAADKSFAGVKVSHHGARNGFNSRLYRDYCTPRRTVAIISNGTDDPNHPHPDVLRTLAERQIRVYSTCWRGSKYPAARSGLPLPGKPVSRRGGAGAGSSAPQCSDITVQILASGRLRVRPKSSLIALNALD
jgi:beta-lactamase superfamily II metal-dependent hydrolase